MKSGVFTNNLGQSAEDGERDSEYGILQDQRRTLTINIQNSTFSYHYEYVYVYENSYYEVPDKVLTTLKAKGALKMINQTHYVCHFDEGDYSFYEKRDQTVLGEGKNPTIKGQFEILVEGVQLKIEKVTFSEKLFRNDRILREGHKFKKNN